jgi:hypothetical protein
VRIGRKPASTISTSIYPGCPVPRRDRHPRQADLRPRSGSTNGTVYWFSFARDQQIEVDCRAPRSTSGRSALRMGSSTRLPKKPASPAEGGNVLDINDAGAAASAQITARLKPIPSGAEAPLSIHSPAQPYIEGAYRTACKAGNCDLTITTRRNPA